METKACTESYAEEAKGMSAERAFAGHARQALRKGVCGAIWQRFAGGVPFVL
jgi:hypothetical protein